MGSLTIAILLGLATFTSQKPQNSYNIPEIESVLQELIAQSPQGDSLDDADKHLSQHHIKNHKNSNLVNLQNLDVIFKDNNLKQKLAAAELSLNQPQTKTKQKVLRDIEEAICETTGRCGCSGTRCGCSGNRCNDNSKDRDNDSKELSKILDSLQSDLENDRSSSNDLRCGCTNNQPHRGYKSPRRGQKYNLRCGCKGKRPYQRTSKNNKDKNYDENGKKTSIDDNLDVVVLELNDLLDKKSNYRDYTRTKDLTREDNSQTLRDYKNNDEINDLDENKKGVSPDVLFDYYQKFKASTINKLVNYVLYQKNDIDISRLSKRQQKIVKDLQEEARFKAVDTGKLEKRLISLVFGPESAVEVLPHNKRNENIYIPQWAYNSMRASRADQPIPQTQIRQKKHSRNVLPLTKRQKLRLQKLIQKQQSEPVKIPQVWRRTLSEDLQNYGAPFELDIQGLGQVNAK